jgi:hypothetical protein
MGATALFTDDMIPNLWTAAMKYAVDPVVVVAQAFKETGGGTFKRLVTPKFYNTAGLKLRHPDIEPGVTNGEVKLAHAMFPSWEVGAEAHVQHLRAYTGCPVVGDLMVDPRYVFVVMNGYRVETVEELSGKWAPSPTYGQEIVELANDLKAAI